MEKKTKLTISGNVKKKIEKFNYSSSKKKQFYYIGQACKQR